MQISARNQLQGRSRRENGDVMAEVTVDVAAREIVRAITRGSVESFWAGRG
jgi:molybdopterin-binding protein